MDVSQWENRRDTSPGMILDITPKGVGLRVEITYKPTPFSLWLNSKLLSKMVMKAKNGLELITGGPKWLI